MVDAQNNHESSDWVEDIQYVVNGHAIIKAVDFCQLHTVEECSTQKQPNSFTFDLRLVTENPEQSKQLIVKQGEDVLGTYSSTSINKRVDVPLKRGTHDIQLIVPQEGPSVHIYNLQLSHK